MNCPRLLSSAPVLLALSFLLPSADGQTGSPPKIIPAPATPPVAVVPDAGPDEPGEPIPGERLDPSAFGPGIVESMEVVLEREAKTPAAAVENRKGRNGAQGTWIVPTRRSTGTPHS